MRRLTAFERDFRNLHGHAPRTRSGSISPQGATYQRRVSYPLLRLAFSGVGLLMTIVLTALVLAELSVFGVFAWAAFT